MDNPEAFDQNMFSSENLDGLRQAREEGFLEGVESEKRFIHEILDSEIEEWSNLIEEAKTPAERKRIIGGILSINRLEALSEKSLRPEGKKELHEAINEFRNHFGLPPKYSE
jgi:hypothetical protein